LQHSSFEKRTDIEGEVRQVGSAPVFPSRQQAVEFPWSGIAAKRRLVHGFDSRNASSRSFNLIRSKLVGLNRDREWRVIGIVSATPNVGKSFVSANVAAAMSRDPRFQTYLVDLDLRRGTIKDIFGIQAETGLVEYLEASDSSETLRSFAPQGQELIIVPAVPGPVLSAELLASDQASALFRAMRNSDNRNFFICDLPPAFANDDASIIMESLDGYVIVAQDGKTTQREIEAAVDLLGHDRLAGVVLNKYRGGLVSEGYGVEYRYASEYYANRDTEEEAD
jgi:Mrp family chromosome partitioning ATPase